MMMIQIKMVVGSESGVPYVKYETGPSPRTARRDQTKPQATPDWQVTVLTSKEVYIGSLS